MHWEGCLGLSLVGRLVNCLGLWLPKIKDVLIVAFLKLSQHLLRVLPVKLIFFVVPEDSSLVEKPDRDIGRLEGRDVSGIRYSKDASSSARLPNRDFRYPNLTIPHDRLPREDVVGFGRILELGEEGFIVNDVVRGTVI